MPTDRNGPCAIVLAATLLAVGACGTGVARANQADVELAQRLAEEGRRAHDPYLLVAAAEILAQDRPHADEKSLEAYLDDAAAFSFDNARIAAEIEKIKAGAKK